MKKNNNKNKKKKKKKKTELVKISSKLRSKSSQVKVAPGAVIELLQ